VVRPCGTPSTDVVGTLSPTGEHVGRFAESVNSGLQDPSDVTIGWVIEGRIDDRARNKRRRADLVRGSPSVYPHTRRRMAAEPHERRPLYTADLSEWAVLQLDAIRDPWVAENYA
jgi:hypothetical protein